MTADNLVLRVRLASDMPAGENFLADICSMLVAIAAKSRVRIVFERVPVSETAEFRAQVPTEVAALAANVGTHRAQLVPEGSPTGRIQTIHVAVELFAAGQTRANSRPDLPLLRTYNYPQRCVVVHATGEKYALGLVLSGSAG